MKRGKNRNPAPLKKMRYWPAGAVIAATIAFAVIVMIRMPGDSHSGDLPPMTDIEKRLQERLLQHVDVLAGQIGERNVWHSRQLEAAGQYIEKILRQSGLTVVRHDYRAEGVLVGNIEAEWVGTERPEEIIVVGAHYDSVIGSPGANDNGSGVAALLEIAAMIPPRSLPRTIRLVAFVNEEPPFFMTSLMGSRVYARKVRSAGDRIIAMFSLETIGHYDSRPGSQRYPLPFAIFYPNTGNFIGFVSNLVSRHLLLRTVSSFRSHTRFPSEAVAAPGWLTGIGWSDHWSFWKESYPAIMITDTALYRYPQYHTGSDTADRLNYKNLARVVAGIERVIADLAANGI